MGIGEVLGAAGAELGGRWRLERRLAGGWNEGAYLLVGGGGSRAVLKWRASDPERLLGARERVEAARDPAVGLDQAALEGLRQMILGGGAWRLAVGGLRDDDLAGLAWSGNPAHLRSVAGALPAAADTLLAMNRRPPRSPRRGACARRPCLA